MNMSQFGRLAAVAGASLFAANLAWAGAAQSPPPTTTTVSGVGDTRAGIGLRFEFGDNVPEVVGTVRHTWTDTNNTVTGAEAELAIPLTRQMHFGPKVRALGLIGSPSVQGLAGVGYDFANMQPLLGVGIQGPYVEGGANYLFDGKFHPYLGVNTFGNAP